MKWGTLCFLQIHNHYMYWIESSYYKTKAISWLSLVHLSNGNLFGENKDNKEKENYFEDKKDDTEA